MVNRTRRSENHFAAAKRRVPQYETWKHTQLIIDVIEGTGGTFSLEGPEGKAFHTRSRVFSDAELAALGINKE